MTEHTLSRRSFLAFSTMLPWALSARAAKSIPTGLELYSVREELKKDPEGTVRAVRRWIPVRRILRALFRMVRDSSQADEELLDDLGIRCFSTHNSSSTLALRKSATPATSSDFGSKYIVMSSSEPEAGPGWLERQSLTR